ncbi:MAG: hypothetical protein Q7K29_04025 [Thermoleophilia bacterium]|nr:hypothetical protein [Thermoleophilia bacterium]
MNDSQSKKITSIFLLTGLIVVTTTLFGCGGTTSDNPQNYSANSEANASSTPNTGDKSIEASNSDRFNNLSGTILFTKAIFEPGQTRAISIPYGISPDGSKLQEIANRINVLSYRGSYSISGNCQYLFVPVNDKYANDNSPETLVVMQVDGSVYREFTPPGEGRIISGAYSPIKSMIAYVREGGELFTIDMEGSLVTTFSLPGFKEGDSIAWSPNASRFAFIAENESGTQRNMFVIDNDGKNLMNLTEKNWPSQEFPNIPSSKPSWSPDSNKLAFIAEVAAGDEIWLFDIHTLKSSKMWSPDSSWSSSKLEGIDWSPHGNVIVFSTERENDSNRPVDIGLIDLNTLFSKRIYRGTEGERLNGWFDCDTFPSVMGQPSDETSST